MLKLLRQFLAWQFKTLVWRERSFTLNIKFTLVAIIMIALSFGFIGVNSEPQLDVSGLDTISAYDLLVTGENFSLEPDGTVAKVEKEPTSMWFSLTQNADLRSNGGVKPGMNSSIQGRPFVQEPSSFGSPNEVEPDVWIYSDKNRVISI